MYVDSFFHSECRDLEKFTPIPWGGLKFLAGLFSILILEAVVGLGMYLVLKADAHLSEGAHLSIAVFVGGALLLIAIPIYFISGSRGEIVRDYFDRNVRGYVAFFYVPTTLFAGQRWLCSIRTEQNSPYVTQAELGGLMLQIRLGGWISSGGSGILKDGKPITHESQLRNWRVCLHKIHFHTGAVLVRVEYAHPDADGKHETLVLEVSEAIHLLNFVQQSGNGVVSISDALYYYMRSKDELAEEAERAREELKRSNGRETMFIDQLESLARRINETDRLKTTIEGLEIYIQVLTALRLAHHATDQAKFDQVSDKLDQAQRDLDRLRSKRSRRSRRSRDIPLVAR